MADGDQNQPTLMQYLAQLFSPTTWAALRYFLAAVSPLLGLFGLAGFSPDKVNSIVLYAQEFGAAVLALCALLGILLPLSALIFGILSSTVKAQIARWKELAKNPTQAGQEAQKAIVAATAEVAKAASAPGAKDLAAALVRATNSLPQVQTIVTDQATKEAVNQPGVVAASQQ